MLHLFPCLQVSLRGSPSRHFLAEMCHLGIPIIRPITFLFVLNSRQFVCDPFRKESPYLSQGRSFAKLLSWGAGGGITILLNRARGGSEG